MIKNSDLDLIEEYLIKNQIININPSYLEHFVMNICLIIILIKLVIYFLKIQSQ